MNSADNKKEDNERKNDILMIFNKANKNENKEIENNIVSQILKGKISKQEFKLKKERLFSNVRKLSLLNFASIIKELLKRGAPISIIIHLINIRLMYEEVDNEEEWTKTKQELISTQINEDLGPYIHYLVEELRPPKFESKEEELASELKVGRATIYNLETFPIEYRINHIIFRHYNDIIKKEFNIDITKILYFIKYCRNFILKQHIHQEKFNQLEQTPYILKKLDVIKNLSNREKNNIFFSKDEIESIITHFSCKFGCEKKEVNSFIQETTFSKKLFILDRSGDQIFFPIFTNIMKKLKTILSDVIKTKYPKRFIKFNEKYPEYLEFEAKNIFKLLFKSKYFKGTFIDGIYETDGLTQYKDYLILIECKKRDLEDSSVREGFNKIKQDVQKSFKNAIEQLKQRKDYILSKESITLYDSNTKTKKIVGTINLKDITKIICIVITSDDYSSILGLKWYHDILKLKILELEFYTISIRNLILFYLILNEPTLFLHYLLSKNRFILNTENFVNFQEELDMIGLYLDGLLNINMNYKNIIVGDYSSKIDRYLLFHQEIKLIF